MKIASIERRYFALAWLGALLWNGIAGFGTVMDFISHPHGFHFAFNRPQDLIPLFVPVVGLALLAWAIRQTVLLLRYGQTYFTSDANQFSLGSRLHGKIMLPGKTVAAQPRKFRLKLSYQMGSGKEAYDAWSDSHRVELTPEGSIPVEFSLPAAVEPQAFVMGGEVITWFLQVSEIGGGFKSFAGAYILPSAEGRYDSFKEKCWKK